MFDLNNGMGGSSPAANAPGNTVYSPATQGYNPQVSWGDGFGGDMNSNGITGGSDFDWGNMFDDMGGFKGLGAIGNTISGGFNAYNGMQQNKLLEENMAFQMDSWNKSYGQKMREYNEYQDKLDIGKYGSVAAANAARAGDQTRTSKYGNVQAS